MPSLGRGQKCPGQKESLPTRHINPLTIPVRMMMSIRLAFWKIPRMSVTAFKSKSYKILVKSFFTFGVKFFRSQIVTQFDFYPQGESCQCVLKPPHPHALLRVTESCDMLQLCTHPSPDNFSPQKMENVFFQTTHVLLVQAEFVNFTSFRDALSSSQFLQNMDF